MKTLAKAILRNNPLPVTIQEKLLFFGKCRYWPKFENPRSFNEKINWRKLNSTNDLYVTCCDKLAVREYVRGKVGGECLVPVVYEGDSITPDQLFALGDDIVVKATHDAGSVGIIRENTMEKATEVSTRIQIKLRSNYGKKTREWWYSSVKPKVYVEKFLGAPQGTPPFDAKFFIFRRRTETAPRVVIEVVYDRGNPGQNRTLYDQNGEVLYCNGERVRVDDEPNHCVPFPCPEQLPEMREVAFKLAEDFHHVRVDLYHVNAHTYFGELTLSTGGGRSRWTPREFDFQMGEYWNLDRSPGGPERPDRNREFVEHGTLAKTPYAVSN